MTEPRENKPKVYQVETEDPIHPDTTAVFAAGIYFAYEALTTRPAQLELLGTHSARLTLYEGRYHQVKRMFGHFNNKVTGLHRESIGHIVLDSNLAPGDYRALTADEIQLDAAQTALSGTLA
jgi:16S rRNA pseudouridine516 synthase